MDQTDIRILEDLQLNARITMTELGKKVGLTAPAAAERIRKLEETSKNKQAHYSLYFI